MTTCWSVVASVCLDLQEAAVLAEGLVGHAKRLRTRRRLISTLRSWSVHSQEQASARAQAQLLASQHDCFRSDCDLPRLSNICEAASARSLQHLLEDITLTVIITCWRSTADPAT